MLRQSRSSRDQSLARPWSQKLSLLVLGAALVFSQAPTEPAWAETSWVQIGDDIIGSTGDYSGRSVAISDDGQVIAVGAYLAASGKGRVRVYEQASGAWQQRGSDIVGPGGWFGRSVALSADGSTVAVGAPELTVEGVARAGRVSVYSFASGDWLLRGSHLSDDETSSFGSSVALSSNANILAVGAPDWSSNQGYTQVFSFSGTGWTPLGGPVTSTPGDRSGYSVDLDSTGTVLAVGERSGGSTGGSGTARVYDWAPESTSWIQRSPVLPPIGTADLFGTSIALSADGTIVAAGGPLNDQGGSNAGEARVWRYNTDETPAQWRRVGGVITGSVGDYLGQSLDLNAAGNRLAVGAPNGDYSEVYELVDNEWQVLGQRIESPATGSFGMSVSIDAAGSTVAIGAYLDDSGGIDAGLARVFTIESPSASAVAPRKKTLGTPGIFLTLTGQMGEPTLNSEVRFGADRIARGERVVLILKGPNNEPSRVLRTLRPASGSTDATITLPELSPGEYRLELWGVGADGKPLRLVNVFRVSNGGVFASLTPESLQPTIR